MSVHSIVSYSLVQRVRSYRLFLFYINMKERLLFTFLLSSSLSLVDQSLVVVVICVLKPIQKKQYTDFLHLHSMIQSDYIHLYVLYAPFLRLGFIKIFLLQNGPHKMYMKMKIMMLHMLCVCVLIHFLFEKNLS